MSRSDRVTSKGMLAMRLVWGIRWALRAMEKYNGRCGVSLAISDGCYEGGNEVDSSMGRVRLVAPILRGIERRGVPAHIISAGGGACRYGPRHELCAASWLLGGD